MKNIKIILLLLVSVIMMMSCGKENDYIVKTSQTSEPMVITAVAEQTETPSKAGLAYKFDILWEQADQIYAKNSSTGSLFTLDESSVGKKIGTFIQDEPKSLSGEVEAFYPASLVYDGSNQHNPTWPAVQEVVAGAGNFVGNKMIPMYSKHTISNPEEPQTFDFSTLGSVLQIAYVSQVAGKKLSSIEVLAADATLSGEFMVENGQAVITATDGSGVVLDFGDNGIEVGLSAKYFNISIPSGTYGEVTLKFNATDGTGYEISTSNFGSIARNTVSVITIVANEYYRRHLPGVFTVDNSGKKVVFSPGNLQADIDQEGNPTKWKFANTQYEFLSEGGANKTIGSIPGPIDLFSWSTTEGVPWGIDKPGDERGYNNIFKDWGIAMGGGWRTLTIAEYEYILNNSTWKWPVTICEQKDCLVIAPDDFTGSIQDSYGADAWATAEDIGLVCLPMSHSRYYQSTQCVVSDLQSGYWSSTLNPGEVDYVYYLHINRSGAAAPQLPKIMYESPELGYSVRLVQDIN